MERTVINNHCNEEMAIMENDTTEQNIACLSAPSTHKFSFTNVRSSRLFFNKIHSFLSKQLFYVDSNQRNKCNSNVVEMHRCSNNGLAKISNTDTNTTYCVSNIHFSGKGKCSVVTHATDMDINIKYKLSSSFKSKFKHDCFNKNEDLIVEYNIKAHSNDFKGSSITEHDISEFNEIIFYPKNILSFKYFELFISSITKESRKTKNKYLTDTTELTIYINIESFWEELFNRPTRDIDTIYLPKEDKNKVINDINWFLSKETQLRYEQLGRNYKRVILFEGVPGSGKTSLALSIASYFGYDIAIMSFTDKVTDGAFTRLIRQIPEKTILLLEDIDCLFHERKSDDNHKNYVTFSGILNTLDGIATPHEFICIITTNYKNLLDDALLRPGRIDNIIKFDYAKRSQVRDIYKAYLGSKYDADMFKVFYSAYQELNVKCPVSLIQEYLFKYLDNPQGALENIDEIKELNDKSTKSTVNVYS